MSSVFSRRGLLKRGLSIVPALGASAALGHLGKISALAATADSGYKALVCVFLFGGNDANNLIVPLQGTALTNYNKTRGTLAVSQPIALGQSGLGIHPNMPGIGKLFNQQNVAVVCNVGTLVAPLTRSQFQAGSGPMPANLFSHLDQQQEWQTASPLESQMTGWAGRLLDTLPALPPQNLPYGVSVGGTQTLLNGNTSQGVCLNSGLFGLVGDDGTALAQTRKAALQQLLTLNSGLKLVQASDGVLNNAIEMAAQVQSQISTAPLPVAFPATDIGQQLAQVARIIRSRSQIGANRQIFFASLSGFDTHSVQSPMQAALLQQLNDAIVAFQTAMTDSSIAAADQVTLFTESEFSRTLQPNTNGGTDHGWGGHHLVVGAAVKGGIYGKFPDLTIGGDQDAGALGNWIPTTSLDQYVGTLASWFGTTNLTSVFPNLNNFNPSTYNLAYI
jgi:uncharacterized protein (DUF1501 family)